MARGKTQFIGNQITWPVGGVPKLQTMLNLTSKTVDAIHEKLGNKD
jgi:hypothetical protein